MTTDDTPTITEQLIEAVRTTPGAGSGYIARAIGSADIHTCAVLLFKLAYIAYRRSGLRRIGLRYEDALRDPLYGTCLRCWATAIERARKAAQRRSA